MKKLIVSSLLMMLSFIGYSQFAVGIGPTYSISKGARPLPALEFSLKYYFFKEKKKTIVVYREVPVRQTIDEILQDSFFGSQLTLYVKYLIDKDKNAKK
jgi:hypothetical protein